MRLLRLQLRDYRNFHRLDVSLSAGPSVFIGGNAQGKSNLLEAVYLLATMRGLHAETDVQLIHRQSLDGPMPAGRVLAEVEMRDGPLKVEVGIVARPGRQGALSNKIVRVNGIPKRLSDAIGRFVAVLFTADDLDLISGPPTLRRRYLDMTLAQVERSYVAARQRFERALLQRNHLLRRIREGEARPDEIPFWDEQLSREGGSIFHWRAAALHELDLLAAEAHASLAPEEEFLPRYRPCLEKAAAEELACADPAAATEAYAAALKRGLTHDIAAGMTLQGPHRDDLLLTLNGLPASGYASRAQQRTIALALRLAEARFLLGRRREPPVLLLDDVLSEMDAVRRRSVLDILGDYEQILVTSTDLDRFPPQFLSGAALFAVEAGSVRPLLTEAASGRIRAT